MAFNGVLFSDQKASKSNGLLGNEEAVAILSLYRRFGELWTKRRFALIEAVSFYLADDSPDLLHLVQREPITAGAVTIPTAAEDVSPLVSL
jgi:hypothetical protein